MTAPGLNADETLELMQLDKKVADDCVRLVLLREMGRRVSSRNSRREIRGNTLQAILAE